MALTAIIFRKILQVENRSGGLSGATLRLYQFDSNSWRGAEQKRPRYENKAAVTLGGIALKYSASMKYGAAPIQSPSLCGRAIVGQAISGGRHEGCLRRCSVQKRVCNYPERACQCEDLAAYAVSEQIQEIEIDKQQA